ncbi:UNVERIFIED_CONTAM: helix-turn-helix domain-containing protein [Streptococcus canis]
MKADEEKIKQLLKNKTQIYIAERTGIAQSKISRIKNGNIKMKNITFEIASKLTELAEELKY